MRELVARFLSHSISRRAFLKGLAGAGISAASARGILDSLVPIAHAQGAAAADAAGFKVIEGSGSSPRG